jgi:peptidoglycan/xylan/chitin deacetylase (PgdA/CDA1 family)
MRFGYLTIDDSPSPHTDALTDFLVERGIPALFFCVGERLAANPEPIIRAIKKGFVIGNHTFHHWRSSQTSFEDFTNDILRTEELIEAAYVAAGVPRPGRYFRFPHMDRGTGGWIIDYDRVDPAYREEVIRLFADGLNIDLTPPSPELMEKKMRLQDWLSRHGFSRMPCDGVTFPWFQGGEMEDAIDAMYTFSTSDWMLLGRHRGKWPWKSLEDLKTRMDGDKNLQNSSSAHIILAHDKEEIDFVTRDLLDHLLGQEFEFLPFLEKPEGGMI